MNTFAIDTNIPALYQILQQTNNIVHTFNNGEITNQTLIDSKIEFLIARSTLKINQKLLENTNVKFVATATTGVDHIDIEYLNKNKIVFFASLGANSNSVAEYIIFSILFAFQNDFNQLLSHTIGIIGYGNIGSKVAYYLDKMGINYIVCDPFLENKYNRINFYPIDYLIENSDIITLHIPLTTSGSHPTFNIINKERIKKIKDNALLINTSRGGICDEKELLNNVSRFQCIIDTWENEPDIANKKLASKILIATPHIAGHSHNGKINATFMICQKLNELYDMKLNYNVDISCKIFDIDMSDFASLYKILSENRKIINSSNEMKERINDVDFATYFNNTRKNYPPYFETLN